MNYSAIKSWRLFSINLEIENEFFSDHLITSLKKSRYRVTI